MEDKINEDYTGSKTKIEQVVPYTTNEVMDARYAGKNNYGELD